MPSYGPETFPLKDGRQLTLRSCTRADAAAFGAFKAQVAAESTHTLQYVGQPLPDAAKIGASWEAALTGGDTLYLGAFDSANRLVGQIACFPDVPNHPWVRHVGRFGMFILKEYWGVGIGRRMLAVLDAMAPRLGYSRLEALVRVDNERGLRLYKNAGYEIEGTRKKAALIEGSFRDELYIAKWLGSPSGA